MTLTDGCVFERDYIPVHSDLGVSHLWIYRDVTERARVDEQRRQAIATERAMRLAIEEQNEALRELNELKNEFVAMVSHELRTPLTSIISFSELLSDAEGSLDKEQRDFLDVIMRNANRLFTLVGDLLLFARLESGTLEITRERVGFGTLVDHAVAAFAGMARDKGIELDLQLSDDPMPALVDPDRFDHGLLIGNG